MVRNLEEIVYKPFATSAPLLFHRPPGYGDWFPPTFDNEQPYYGNSAGTCSRAPKVSNTCIRQEIPFLGEKHARSSDNMRLAAQGLQAAR